MGFQPLRQGAVLWAAPRRGHGARGQPRWGQCRGHCRCCGTAEPRPPPAAAGALCSCAPWPAAAPRARRAARAYFYPWESHVSSVQTHLPCRNGCLRSSLISPWRSRCGAGSRTCRLAALFRQPRTDGAAAGDRRTPWLGSGSGDLPRWVPGSHLPAPASPSHSIPTCPPVLPPAAWPRGDLQVPGPAPSIPAPGAATCRQCGPSPGWAGSSGAEVSLFLAACSGIWWWGGLCPRLPSLAGSRSPGPGALLRPSWADCTG